MLYFLRQGVYNGQGDIAVLCAYLGQLQKVRAALRDLKIAVSVDERDAEQLVRQGLDEEVEFEEVLVTKHVSLACAVLRKCLDLCFDIGSPRDSRYIPRAGSEDRHRLPCAELGPD